MLGRKRRGLWPGILVGAFVWALAGNVSAAQTVLTLENPSKNIRIELSREDLLAMPQVTVKTGNEFVDGVAEFSGPLARDVISLLGGGFDVADFYAVNDYSIPIPVADFENYDVVMALFMNGKRFSLRDKGPIWLIYPMTGNPELQDKIYNDRLIWQLVRVSAR